MQPSPIMNVVILSTVAGLLCASLVNGGELYQWTDEQGHLHITDVPPAVTHKKSVLTVVPAPPSASPKKVRVQPVAPEQPQAEVRPLPAPTGPSSGNEKVPSSLTIEGLNPFQAIGVSPWQVSDSSERDARAPVQSWKDKQGLEHFVDVLPASKGGAIAGPKGEDTSRPGTTRKGKE